MKKHKYKFILRESDNFGLQIGKSVRKIGYLNYKF